MRAFLAALALVAGVTIAHAESGIASVYGTPKDGYCGRPVACSRKVCGDFGGVLDCRALTAGHRTLPFGARVKVKINGSGRSIAVRINDRGPFVASRIIDLTPATAQVLGCQGLCAGGGNGGGNGAINGGSGSNGLGGGGGGGGPNGGNGGSGIVVVSYSI